VGLGRVVQTTQPSLAVATGMRYRVCPTEQLVQKDPRLSSCSSLMSIIK